MARNDPGEVIRISVTEKCGCGLYPDGAIALCCFHESGLPYSVWGSKKPSPYPLRHDGALGIKAPSVPRPIRLRDGKLV